MVEEWVIKKFNRGFNQPFYIKENDGVTVKNVSGYTILVSVWEKGASTTIVSGSCVIASATTGYVYYTLTSGTFSSPGKYLFELELLSSGQVELRDTLTYSLRLEDSAPRGG